MLGCEKQALRFRTRGGWKTVALEEGEAYQNCVARDGVLRGEGGVAPILIGNEAVYIDHNLPLPVQFFRAPNPNGGTGLGYLSDYGYVFLFDESIRAFVRKHAFYAPTKAVVAYDGEDTERLFFIGGAGIYEYVNGEVVAVQGEEGGFSNLACASKDRIYVVVKPHSIAYSAPLFPADFSSTAEEGGKIAFPCNKGEIVAIAPHGNGLAIFYEYGVAVLATEGSARNFVWKAVAYGGGKILTDSACNVGVGGEKTFFLAEDGVYALDKETVRKVAFDLTIKPKGTGQVCNQAVYNGKYYATYEDEERGRLGIILDTQSEKGCASFPFRALCNCGGLALAMTNGRCVSVLGGEELPSEASARVRFEKIGLPLGRKLLRTVAVQGEGEVKLTLSDGKRERTFTLLLSAGQTRTKVRLYGERFSIECQLLAGAKVREIALEWCALAGSSVKKERGRRAYGD